MSMPLHVNDFEVRSPNTKYRCVAVSRLARMHKTSYPAPNPLHLSHARSDTMIESTYQYQTTEVVKEGGKTVRHVPTPVITRVRRATHHLGAQLCYLGAPADRCPEDGRVHVPHGAQEAEARADAGRLGWQ